MKDRQFPIIIQGKFGTVTIKKPLREATEEDKIRIVVNTNDHQCTYEETCLHCVFFSTARCKGMRK